MLIAAIVLWFLLVTDGTAYTCLGSRQMPHAERQLEQAPSGPWYETLSCLPQKANFRACVLFKTAGGPCTCTSGCYMCTPAAVALGEFEI